MTDTARTLAALQTLLADNTSRAISPQDVRDLLVSVAPAYGELSLTTPAETSIALTDTWYPASGTFTLTAAVASEFDMNTNAQLRYTGTPDRIVTGHLSASATAVGVNKLLKFGIGLSGADPAAPSVIQRFVSTGTDEGAFACHFLTVMSTNDYLTIMVQNTTDDSNLTIEHATLTATAFIT